MNITETKLNIKILKDKESALLNMQGNSQEKTRLLADIRSEIKNLEMSLPQKRLTVQNSSTRPQRSSGAFSSFGEQLKSVALAENPGQMPDNRLFNAATGANETVPSDGGFLVQQDFSGDLLGSIFEPGTLPGMCNKFNISGNANSMVLPAVDETSRVAGSRYGGTRGYWLAEAAEITASQPKFRRLELLLKKMAVMTYATDEVISDAAVLEKVIRQSFEDEMSFMLNEAILRGSGAGQPLGILNSGALVTASKEAGQSADTIVYENVLGMWSRLLPRSKKSAVWLINQDIEPQLYQMSLSVGTGGAPVFMPGGGASDQPYATLFGRPIIPTESCSTLGDVGDIVLADLANGYILADKGGAEFASSIHVRFVYDESVFRLVYRCDGQPLLASPITPNQGSSTQSHFVALEARS